MSLDRSVEPGIMTTEMSHDGAPWTTFATGEEPAFNEALNQKLLYASAADLPPAIRYLSPDHSIVLFERPPCYVSFQYTKKKQADIATDQASKNVLRLPLPWQRYVLLLSKANTIANLFLFFSQHQINDLYTDPMCVAPVLNFYGKGRLCPASYAKLPEYEHSIPGAIDAAYDLVWHSGFNWDTTLAIQQLKYARNNPLGKFGEDYVRMFQFWAGQSLEAVLGWPWAPGYESFMELAQSMDLRYQYAGKTDDIAVSFALSAQMARS